MYNTPILYIIFNRLDTVEKTFESIRNIKPKKLYIASDGARPEKIGEAEKIQQVRDYVINHIDWECDIHTLFRDKNLGCKYGPADAIKWFFNQVEQGVVLEDDILATESFFEYCELLLNHYKGNQNIGYICGCTMPDFVTLKNKDYFLTTVIDGWGWASWKNVIKGFDPDCASLQKHKLKDINSIFLNKKAKKQILKLSLLSAENKIDAWDYQMADFMAVNGHYSIFPKKPLVRNIGFIADSTHTALPPAWYKDVSYDYQIKIDDDLLIDNEYTKKYEEDFLDKRSLLRKICSNIKRNLRLFYKSSK